MRLRCSVSTPTTHGSESNHHKVETSHEQDHVDQEEPMLLKSNPSFRNKSSRNIVSSFSDFLALRIHLSLWEHETENNEQNWRPSTEPEKLLLS